MLVTALAIFLAPAAMPASAPVAAPATQGVCDGGASRRTAAQQGGGCMVDTPPPKPLPERPKPKKFGGVGPSNPGEGPGGPLGPDAVTPGGPAGPLPLGPAFGPAISTYDPLRWAAWWRMERDGFLDLREKVRRRHTMGTIGLSAIARPDLPPSRTLVESSVVPSLIAVLESSRSDEMLNSALVALARIGAGTSAGVGGVAPARMEAALTRHLASSSQEVSETAALALGIFGACGSFDTLVELLIGSEAGAALVGRGQVPTRTSAFAAFGMGVLAYDTPDVAQRQLAAAALLEALGQTHARPDVPVAAMMALGQCRLPAQVTLPPASLRGSPYAESVMSSSAMLRWLLERLEAKPTATNVSSPKERAFALVALGHFASTAEEDVRADVMVRLRKECSNRRLTTEVRSAAVVALGEVARSGKSAADRTTLKFLAGLIDSSQPLERRLGAMALAQASARAGQGDEPLASAESASRELQQMLQRGGSMERPWGALALGVQAFYLHQQAGTQGPVLRSSRLEQHRAEMRAALAKQKSSISVGAYAIGVALIHKGAQADALEKAGEVTLAAYHRTGEPEAKGHVAIALGLLGYAPAKNVLFAELDRSMSRPSLLWHNAVGLGLIGDERLSPKLIEALIAARSHQSRAALAVSLGAIGDRRAVKPLLELIENEAQPTASRAMAIVGVGVLCEERALPWRNPMAHALPYAAMTATLSGESHPIFDIH